jgi:cytochrome c oxidase assembly protein subunit 15
MILLSQIALGILVYKLHLQVEPLTVAHQSIGALLLGTLLAFTLGVWRDALPQEAP